MCRLTNLQTRLPRATSSLALNASRDGASTASVGNLFSASPPSVWNNFLLRSNLNLPCLSLKPFPLVLSLDVQVSSTNVLLLCCPSSGPYNSLIPCNIQGLFSSFHCFATLVACVNGVVLITMASRTCSKKNLNLPCYQCFITFEHNSYEDTRQKKAPS